MNQQTGYGTGSPKITLAPVPFPTQKTFTTADFNYQLGQLVFNETTKSWIIYSGDGQWFPFAENLGLTNHAIAVGNSVGGLSSIGLGATGAVLLSGGSSSDPAFSSSFSVSDATPQASLVGAGTGKYPTYYLENQDSVHSDASSIIRFRVNGARSGDACILVDPGQGDGPASSQIQYGFQNSTQAFVVNVGCTIATIPHKISGSTAMSIACITGLATFPLSDVYVSRSQVGNVNLVCQNLNASASGCAARVALVVNSTVGASDPFIQFGYPTVVNKMGVDQSDSGTFKYNVAANGASTGMEGTTVFSITQAGSTTLGASAATPTHSINTLTATSANAGANGDVPAQVVGYITINVNGAAQKIPYYAV